MRYAKLSPKEKEVALLVSKGYKDVEITKELYVSRRRVGELIASIKEKWGIRSRVEIGVMVALLGWLRWPVEEKTAGVRRHVQALGSEAQMEDEVQKEELAVIDGGFPSYMKGMASYMKGMASYMKGSGEVFFAS